MSHSQFLSISSTHQAQPPLPHAISPPPDCWEVLSGLDFARMSQEEWNFKDKPGELLSFRKMASKSRGVGRASSMSCVPIRNRESQHLAPHFTGKGRQSPDPSVNWALLPHFFTLIFLIHGPLPPSPCEGLLLQLHQCYPSSTPSCLKAMADAAKLIILVISTVTQDKAAEFPPPVNMYLYSCWCHLQIPYEVSNFYHITSSTETKSLSWRDPQAFCTCLCIRGMKQNNLITSVTFLIVIKMCDIHQKPTQSLGNKTSNFWDFLNS